MMYLIKGYNVGDENGNIFRQVRFSGFSNLIINSKKVGEQVELEVFRDGKNLTIKVTLTSQ